MHLFPSTKIFVSFGSFEIAWYAVLTVDFEETLGHYLAFLSKYTMPIFLMHTLFAAPMRSILLKIGIENGIVHILLGLSISFLGPIVATWIMKKSKWLEFFLYPNKFIKD